MNPHLKSDINVHQVEEKGYKSSCNKSPCAHCLPDTSPLNGFSFCVWITLISFQLPSPTAVLNQAPSLACEGNVGKSEKGNTTKSCCEKEVRTKMESGSPNPETSVTKTCSIACGKASHLYVRGDEVLALQSFTPLIPSSSRPPLALPLPFIKLTT